MDYLLNLGMATFTYFIQDTKEDPTGIYARVKDGRTIDAKAKTKFVINRKDWSKAKKEPLNKNATLKQLKTDLVNYKTSLIAHYNKSVEKEVKIDTQWLKDFISPDLNKVQKEDLLLTTYFDKYLSYKKNRIKPRSYKAMGVFKQRVVDFEDYTGKQYNVEDVNVEFAEEFEEWAKDEALFAQNTIEKTVKAIKTVCYYAQTKGVKVSNDLKSIKSHSEDVSKVYLTYEELEKIEKLQITNERLINIRDWLMISCATGQRVSDFMDFSQSIIEEKKNKSGDTVKIIKIKQQKTEQLIPIPLDKSVVDILERRNGEFPPKKSAVNFNKYVKELCKMAGLDELTEDTILKKVGEKKVTRFINGKSVEKVVSIIRNVKGIYPKYETVSSHIGRRSFATNHYGGDIPTALIMKVTGHSTERAFLKYIGKPSIEFALELSEYFNKNEKNNTRNTKSC